MGESSGRSNRSTPAIATQPGPASNSPPSRFDSSGRSVERASRVSSRVSSIEEIIDKSKSHRSQLRNFGCDTEAAKVSNMELFKTLQVHSIWGGFLQTFGKGEGSFGELVMGEKFAEGGRAEICDLPVKFQSLTVCQYAKKRSFVLKVFKKGTSLHHVQLQWPQGMLQRYANQIKLIEFGLPVKLRFYGGIVCGTLLDDARFAFLMIKEKEDLQKKMNCQILRRSNDVGPFPMWKALKVMYEVALGMNQLHNDGIIHRDIKASNVLLVRFGESLIANYECSTGVVGIGFWRALEILEACKCRNVNTKPSLFTKVVDIYSYGMSFYKILTSKVPFEGHPWSDYDLVLQGQRPQVPNYVDG